MKSEVLISQDYGFHNKDLERSAQRITKGRIYKNCNTIVVIPTRGSIPAKVVQSWLNLQAPMNHGLIRMFVQGMEVGDAYQNAFEYVINDATLKSWPYILTLEEDNIPPSDGLVRLIESLESSKYGAVGGLYWTKGEGGQPMIYGDPNVMPKNFVPQIPVPETLQECNGLGMGFTLFRSKMFSEGKIEKPWFKTLQNGGACFTQDLYFFNKACAVGWKFAVDTRVKVGHYDVNADMVW